MIIALHMLGAFLAGFATASIYTWYQLVHGKRGVRGLDGTIRFFDGREQ